MNQINLINNFNSNNYYIQYFIYKYIYIYYKNLKINKIYLHNLNNTFIIYIILNNINKSYNLKKQLYLIKSLEYFLKIPIKIYCLNLNYNFIENILNKNYNKKLKFKNILINYNKLIKNNFKEFKNIFLIFLFSLFFKDFKLFNNIINLILKKTSKHFQILKMLKHFLNYFFFMNNNLKGIKLQIKGRLNGSLRSKKYSLIIGTLQAQTFKNQLYFNHTQLKTNYGICGIKLWISFI